jgi:uncharacterized ferritin-like protein (DUF455 family)
VGDRLRAAAFAEIQAREAFLWAAERFADESDELKRAWRELAVSEQLHLDWLLGRMRELDVAVEAREVSDFLWRSFMNCGSAREFAHFMAGAEERGRRAGERFHEQLQTTDPESARIFGRIAEEEVAHIALAERFFPSEKVRPETQAVGTASAQD